MVKPAKKSYIAAIGRRKTASARVRFYKKGEGKILVNNIKLEEYFPTTFLQIIVNKPLKIVNLTEPVDIEAKVCGGGVVSQAQSLQLGIARALVELDEENKKKLKKADLLTRDPRKKERKKPGLRRARRAPQWSKR